MKKLNLCKTPIIQIHTINIYDQGDLKGYADGVIVVGEQAHEFLYRIIDDPKNGPGDTLVSVDWGYKNPLVPMLWTEIKQAIRNEIKKGFIL